MRSQCVAGWSLAMRMLHINTAPPPPPLSTCYVVLVLVCRAVSQRLAHTDAHRDYAAGLGWQATTCVPPATTTTSTTPPHHTWHIFLSITSAVKQTVRYSPARINKYLINWNPGLGRIMIHPLPLIWNYSLSRRIKYKCVR